MLEREVNWKVIVLSAAVYAFAAVIVNAIVFRGLIGAGLQHLSTATGGVVQPTLVGSLLMMLAFLAVVLGIGRLPLESIGWTRSKALLAVPVVIGFWGAMQLALTAIAIATGQGFKFHQSWTSGFIGTQVGALIAQLFGNALSEETACRGFFFNQFRLKFKSVGSSASFILGGVASAALFAVSHLPNRLFVKATPFENLLGDQLQLVISGLIFAVVYVATRNLFIATGLHALANEPTPAVEATGSTVKGIYLLMLFTVVIAYGFIRFLSAKRVCDTESTEDSG